MIIAIRSSNTLATAESWETVEDCKTQIDSNLDKYRLAIAEIQSLYTCVVSQMKLEPTTKLEMKQFQKEILGQIETVVDKYVPTLIDRIQRVLDKNDFQN